MRPVLLLAILLTACRGEPSAEARSAPSSFCRQQMFDGSGFTVCDAGGGRIELLAAARGETAVRRLPDLEARLGDRSRLVAFAMNAGMYDEDGRPIGLAIVEGRQVRSINRRSGGGNFHLMPNGVFQVRKDGRAEVVTSAKWRPSRDIRIATQSGPMLVIDGRLHPAFDHDGNSRHVRNGVGIDPEGRPLFVISDEPVSLGKFARFFRDDLRTRNALFFDGAVSALWDPGNYRRDLTVPLGPILVAFRPAESAPDREGRATP